MWLQLLANKILSQRPFNDSHAVLLLMLLMKPYGDVSGCREHLDGLGGV